MLFARGRLAAGETMLVLGASGGVGIACLQFGKMTGARLIAAAGSAAKCRRLEELGADHAIDYSQEDFSRAAWLASGKKGCDVVVNFTGGDTWAPCLRTAKRGGRVLTCGATAGHDPATDLRYIWVRELDVLGSNSYAQEDVERSVEHVAAGRLAPVVSHTFPLSETGAAERPDGGARVLREDRHPPLRAGGRRAHPAAMRGKSGSALSRSMPRSTSGSSPRSISPRTVAVIVASGAKG